MQVAELKSYFEQIIYFFFLFLAVTGLKFRNKYSVKNNLNQKVLVATEETNLCSKVIFGKKRDFIMRIYDTSMNEVLILKRAASCCICCIPSTLQVGSLHVFEFIRIFITFNHSVESMNC